MTSDTPRLRFAIVGIVTMSLIAALFARVWYLQVMTSPQYQAVAATDHVRVVRVEAPRGRILDREGNVLVDNRRSIEVTADYQAFNKLSKPMQNTVLTRLAPVLNRYAQQQYQGQCQNPGPVATTTPVSTHGRATTSTTSTSTSTTTTTAPSSDSTTPGTVPAAPPTTLTVAGLEKRLNDVRFSHFAPVPLVKDVSVCLETYLSEHATDFPTISAQDVLVREYPYGEIAAQLLGWVGPIDASDLEQYQNKAKPYANSDEIGRSGVEREFEPLLRGTPGSTTYEVNAQNQIVRTISSTPAVPGNDVYLTVDIRVQYLAEEALAAAMDRQPTCSRTGCTSPKTGTVVMTDPRNGQVLAMASYPTYDPNLFVGGITEADYKALNDDPAKPLVNKVIGETYPAGSTWKLFTAYSGLTHGQITPDTVVYDPGSYRANGCPANATGCVKYGADHAEHGNVDLSQAITVSSDVYFYKLGDEMWDHRNDPNIGDDALAKSYELWGFGSKTGVGLPGEFKGLVPSPEANLAVAKALYKGDPEKIKEYGAWSSGQNMNSAIGQGLVAITPLQLVNGYATFANGGTLYRPQLVLEVNKGFSKTVVSVPKPQAVRQIPFPLAWKLPMLAGFEGVTQNALGTAGTTFAGFPQSTFPVAGKTGTAQVQGKSDTSLFASFAPATNPQYAAVAILPEGGNGGTAAAPLIRSILQPLAEAGGNMAQLPAAPPGGQIDAQAFAAASNYSSTSNND